MNLFRKGAGQRWWMPRRICIWFIDANRYSMKEECHKRPDTGVLWRSLDFSDKSRWNGHINTPCRMIGSFQNVVHGGLSLRKETVNESKLGCFEQSSFLQTKMDADMINGVLGIKRGDLYNHQKLGFNMKSLSRDPLEIEWSFWQFDPFTTEVPHAGLILLRRSIPWRTDFLGPQAVSLGSDLEDFFLPQNGIPNLANEN